MIEQAAMQWDPILFGVLAATLIVAALWLAVFGGTLLFAWAAVSTWDRLRRASRHRRARRAMIRRLREAG